MRSPSRPTEENTRSTVERIRKEGLADPTVQMLLKDLPRFPGTGQEIEPGLYACARKSPWLVVKGELRISLVRLYASNGENTQLVAQIHVTAPMKDLDRVRLRGYVHDPRHFSTQEVVTLEQWWIEALERHYKLGGPEVSVGTVAAVPA